MGVLAPTVQLDGTALGLPFFGSAPHRRGTLPCAMGTVPVAPEKLHWNVVMNTA